jgi:hypothetical protein
MTTRLIFAPKLLLIGLALIALPACKKVKTTASSADTTASSGTGSTGTGAGNTNFVAGGGAVQNVRQAVRRTVALNDMSQLGQLIELQYNESGKMPTVSAIKDNLNQAQNILSHINEGSIILTGTTNHAGLWAYEIDADTKGGIILQAGSARRATRDEVLQLLGRSP